MDTHYLTFNPGDGPKTLPAGNFLRLMETVHPVSVEFFRGGRLLEKSEWMEQGEHFRPGDEPGDGEPRFTKCIITSVNPQVMKVGVGYGSSGSEKIEGVIQVSEVVAPLAPHELADSYFYGDGSVAVETIVAPAANTNGIVIYAASAYSGGGGGARVMFKSSIPSGWSDTGAGTLAACHAGVSIQQEKALPLLIPAGKGLFCVKTTVSGQCSIEYRVL